MTVLAPSATSIKLDSETKARVQRLAQLRQRTPHWLMLDAIRQYVAREEKLEAFRQEGVSAWQAFQSTGLHVTEKAADEWLAKLESGQDAEPPACRV